MKKVVVLSLGGSLIVPNEIDVSFLKKFKKIILKHANKNKFIIICGGGSIARKYISALRKTGMNEIFQSYAGISATRMNARFMSYFFNIDPKEGLPHTAKEVESLVKKRDIVFCGALEYHPNQTSDATSAQIASHFKTIFINLTNVDGMYDKNPLENKNAKFIPKITWEEFDKVVNKIKYEPGQHFVLDQSASKIIKANKIPTYILGKKLNNLDNLLKDKKFKGTIISG